MTFVPTLLLLLPSGGPEPDVVLDRPVSAFKVETEFRAALGEPLTASWRNVGLRQMFRRIADDRKVSLLLDRRIDPTQSLEVELRSTTTEDAVRQIAGQVGAEISVAGNTIYVGPPAGAARLRTLIELRANELFHPHLDAESGDRALKLTRHATIHWQDLDRPADILSQIAEKFGIALNGLDQVPHDLWAGNTLPHVTAYEALSLVLIQFDLTFVWGPERKAVSLVDIPDTVTIERLYSPLAGKSVAETIALWRQEAPGLAVEPAGDRIRVRGTVEQHAALEPASRTRSLRGTHPDPEPVHNRLFTLRLKRVPASALMRKLEESGIRFEFDERELRAAAIDLDQPISLMLNKADADEFFEAVFDPLGVAFEIDLLTVTLRPKE